ncbi:NAD(P)-dependent oxidoreductase [Leptospira kmetyi]|uniref:NAD(P)-dependent oxidoreductase n=1 Tax=Leptospira kmetyi TaxID=408139 RepID=UPI0002881318|nr:NAD(P)-dependent oxidoreductase [Leptospira kmetyi]EQA54400.1 4-phosphoerythronate dehydrogenase [Leptospira kmetyi serovar Malaysia str. Bejo-Iso9]
MKLPKILVITPIRHIAGVCETLESCGEVTYLDDPSEGEMISLISEFDAIFTNPNKSKVYLGKNVLDAAKKLNVICTASTGTNHIDKSYASIKGVTVLSLTEEREVINRISSTAELAFTLTMVCLRKVVQSHHNALLGEWDYTQYIGRQMNCLTVGVIGYGRLGTFYAHYCRSFGANVLIYDPYKKVEVENLEQVDNIDSLLSRSDVISLHVHVSNETLGLIDSEKLSKMKKDVLLVNTSRGEIINEVDLVDFLRKNPEASVGADVLADEIRDRLNSPLLKYAQESKQVILTQHIGGMTREAQEIAYGHAAKRLKNFFKTLKE